jgi:hypothetical protein
MRLRERCGSSISDGAITGALVAAFGWSQWAMSRFPLSSFSVYRSLPFGVSRKEIEG